MLAAGLRNVHLLLLNGDCHLIIFLFIEFLSIYTNRHYSVVIVCLDTTLLSVAYAIGWRSQNQLSNADIYHHYPSNHEYLDNRDNSDISHPLMRDFFQLMVAVAVVFCISFLQGLLMQNIPLDLLQIISEYTDLRNELNIEFLSRYEEIPIGSCHFDTPGTIRCRKCGFYYGWRSRTTNAVCDNIYNIYHHYEYDRDKSNADVNCLGAKVCTVKVSVRYDHSSN